MPYLHRFITNHKLIVGCSIAAIGWIIVLWSNAATSSERAVSVLNTGFALFVIGVLTILFIPIYLLQRRLFSLVSNDLQRYFGRLSIVNAYFFVVSLTIAFVGAILGFSVLPVFMISPGLFFGLWVAEKIDRRLSKHDTDTGS